MLNLYFVVGASVVASASIAPGTSLGTSSTNGLAGSSHGGLTGPQMTKMVPLPVNNIKFTPIEDVHCRGLLRKVDARAQFIRHVANKLDVSEFMSFP